MWAYLTNGAEPEQIEAIEAALDGKPDAPSGGSNVSALLAGMKGG